MKEHSPFACHAYGTNRLKMTGSMTFDQTATILQKTRSYFQPASTPLIMDFSEMEYADSAGLAMLVEWLRWAHRVGLNLRFMHVPDNMLALGRVSGLDTILPFSVKETS